MRTGRFAPEIGPRRRELLGPSHLGDGTAHWGPSTAWRGALQRVPAFPNGSGLRFGGSKGQNAALLISGSLRHGFAKLLTCLVEAGPTFGLVSVASKVASSSRGEREKVLPVQDRTCANR